MALSGEALSGEAPSGEPPAAGPLPDLIDTHAHLHDKAFDADRPEVLRRARAAGLSAIVTVGTDHRENDRALLVANQEPDVFAVVGFHPNDAKDWNAHERGHVERLATTSERVVAIGEIGLDFFRDLSPRDAQARVFEDQLSLADQVGLPVVIHSRDAHEETFAILSSWARHGRREAPIGVIHCFSGDAYLARRYVDLGFVISIAGPVTYPKNDDLREAAIAVPRDGIVVETDCPYLTPQSRRGKRNEPALVAETAAYLAELRGDPVAEFVSATAETARTLFRLPPAG